MRSYHKTKYFIIGSLFILQGLNSCDREKPTFKEWYPQGQAEKSEDAFEETAEFYSTDLLIDTIYRSMQGPYEIKPVSIDGSSNELIWITGYESRVLQAESNVNLGPAFMCHNNLDYAKSEQLPWLLKTSGANHRIFTLSQGQNKIVFPDGFGIPILADQKLQIVSQVLNHHQPDLYINTKHRSILHYIRESERSRSMTPLYQQAVFVTKQIAGAEGDHGLPLSCLPYHDHSEESKEAEVEHDCSIEYSREADYNPYQDKYGRKYTGHWVIPFGADTIQTNVTKMLDLQEETRIHFISVHLHPFAEALELWDITEDKLLYEAEFTKDSLNFGFKEIDFYSSKEGIKVYPDHQYELISAYNCTDSLNEHSAMAVMYLYLKD